MVDLVQYCRDLEARLKVVLEENAALKEQIRDLIATNQRLEARLRLNSQNSSQPPSQDGPRRPLKREKKRSGLRPGGQPGHPGKTRDRLPAERVDEVHDCDPTTWGSCGDPLQDRPRLEGFIRQVIEAPVVRALVSEFHLWKKRCAKCGGFTWGELPPGAPAGAFGPRLQALIALFTGMFELSRRDVVEVLRTVLDVDLCLGSVQGCCEAVSEAVAPTVQEVHADLKASPVVHADETSFGLLDGHHRWLWILASGDSEAFLLQEGRGQQEAIALLGPDFKGVLIRDRWRPYEVFDGFGEAINLATDLMRQWDWLWTFVFFDAVDPTNNRAESGIRRAVIWEKTSFGAHSDAGCRFVERILTIVGTARRRGIAVLDWLTRAVQAHLDGRRAPPFVPAQPAAA